MAIRQNISATGATSVRTIQSGSIEDVISQLSVRLRRLEQTVSATSAGIGTKTGRFENIIIGGKYWIDTVSSAPTGLVLTTGAFFDDIFIDVAWKPPVDESAHSYSVDLAKKNADGTYQLQQTHRTGSNNIRINALQASVTYGVRVIGENRIGVQSTYLPTTGYQDITTAVDATVPPAPTGVTLSRGATSAVVKYTPLTKEQAPDVANSQGQYEVELHTNSTYTALFRSKYTVDQITAFNDIIAETTVFARVRAIDSSGNAGPWANAAAGAPVGAVADNMILAGLDAAKITVGFLSGSRIEADSLEANRIKSSALTTQTLDLAGGQFRVLSDGTTGSVRMIINSQGISFYKPDSTRSIFFDSATGIGAFQGDITGSTMTASTITGATIEGGAVNGALITGSRFRTAVSGNRLEIQTSGTFSSQIQFITQDDMTSPARLFATASAIELQSGRISSANVQSEILMKSDDSLGPARIQIKTSFIRIISDATGGNASITSNFTNTNGQEIACGNGGATDFIPCAASLFRTASMSEYKKDISDLAMDPMPTIKSIPVKQYRRKNMPPDSPLEIGFVADNMPGTIKAANGYNLNAVVALLWKAMQGADNRMINLDERLKKLEPRQ